LELHIKRPIIFTLGTLSWITGMKSFISNYGGNRDGTGVGIWITTSPKTYLPFDPRFSTHPRPLIRRPLLCESKLFDLCTMRRWNKPVVC
jgi:hypothetical protein